MGYEIGVKCGYSDIFGVKKKKKLVILRENAAATGKGQTVRAPELPLSKGHRIEVPRGVRCPNPPVTRLITRNDGRLIAGKPRIAFLAQVSETKSNVFFFFFHFSTSYNTRVQNDSSVRTGIDEFHANTRGRKFR